MAGHLLMFILTVTIQALSLIGLRLRLQSRIHAEHMRRETLVAVARTLPEASELVERRSDGTQLRLTIGTVIGTSADNIGSPGNDPDPPDPRCGIS